jgi:nucleoside-diphosphate-sugar epimerase
MLRAGGADPAALNFVAADLLTDAGWPAAVAGCDFVLHVASPFPPDVPLHEDDLIRPAREGTLRVLRAARDAGVRRVVITSSFAAIGYGTEVDRPYTEQDWSNPDAPGVTAYAKSKTLAERAAWDFFACERASLELAVVNPVAVFGPVLGPDFSTSVQILQMLLNGAMPACPPCPQISFGLVDVRDVADLHLRAMTSPAANGQRFLAVSGEFMSIQQIAAILRQHLGPAARRVPTRLLPNWILRVVALFNPTVAQIVPELGKTKTATNRKAIEVLGWQPRSNEASILDTAHSLQQLGLLKP